MKKKVLSLLLALVMVVGLMPAAMAAETATFKDVGEDMWCFDYVEYVAEEGFFKGTTATTFNPNGLMTRQQFVTVLARMAGVKVDNSKTAFSDVPAGSYSAGSVAWAAKYGIVTGYDDGTFKPTAPITRQQMCAIMSRFMDYYADVHGAYFLKRAKVSSFVDYGTVSDYAKTAVDRCRAYGLIQGYAEDNTFRPHNNATRAHVAAVIFRLAQVLQIGGGSGGGGKTYTLTYVSNPMGTEKKVSDKNKTGAFTVKDITAIHTDAAQYAGKAFLNWMDEDKSYAAGDALNLKDLGIRSKTLTANWADEEDLLYIAMVQASDYFTNTVTQDDQLEAVKAELEDYITLADITMVTNKTENDGREVVLSVPVTLDTNLYTHLVKTAFYYAYDVLELAGKSNDDSVLTVEELEEIVKNVLDILNITYASDADLWEMAEELADQIHDELIAIGEDKGYGDDMWACFEPAATNNQPIIDAVKVMDGNQVLTVYNQDKTYTYGDGAPMTEKKALERVAEAAGESLYDSLIAHDDEFVTDLKLEATLDLEFVLSDEAEPIAGAYPTEYTAIARMDLTQENPMVAYRYDAGKHYVKLIISELMQTEYSALIEASVEKAMDEVVNDPDLNEELVDVVVDKILDEVKGDKFESYVKATEDDLTVAVENWIEANFQTVSVASNDFVLMYDYLWLQDGVVTDAGLTQDGRYLFDNSELSVYIDTVAVDYLIDEYDQYNLTEKALNDVMLDLVTAMLKDYVEGDDVEGNSAFSWANDMDMIDNAMIDTYVSGELTSAAKAWRDVAEGIVEDELEDARVSDESIDEALEIIEAVDGGMDYLKSKALNMVGLTQAYPVDAIDEANMMKALAAEAKAYYDADVDVILTDMISDEDGDYKYVDYLNNVKKIRYMDGLDDVKISELCDLLTNEDVLDALDGETAPDIVDDVAWAVKELEELMIDGDVANVYIDGVELKLSSVTALRKVLKDDSADAADMCKAVAKFLAPFGELQLCDFYEAAGGVEFQGNFKYEDYSFDPQIVFMIEFA